MKEEQSFTVTIYFWGVVPNNSTSKADFDMTEYFLCFDILCEKKSQKKVCTSILNHYLIIFMNLFFYVGHFKKTTNPIT